MNRGYEMIVIPHGSGGVMRYFSAAFLMAWLGGWAVGWVAAFGSLFKAGGPGAFILFWLVGWTVGGGFVIWNLFRILRPSIPEELTLALPSLIYDSGTAPFTMAFDYRSRMDVWKNMLKKRKKIEFGEMDLQTLRLRETEGGNRVTLDHGAERIDLGSSLTEVEREWLFSILASRYKVERTGSAPSAKQHR